MKHNLLKTWLCLLVILSSAVSGGNWRDGVPLITPREGAASVAMGNYIYVFGGRTLNGLILNTVERFNTNSKVWEPVVSFGTPRMNAAAIVHNNKILLTGGRSSQSGEAIAQVEIYDTTQNQWQSAQDMHKEREGHALAFFNNRVYAIGGARDANHLEDDIEWYDDSTGEWQDAPFKIISERVAFYSAVVRDTFYMFGGYYYGPLNTIYYKPPQTLDWITSPYNMFTAMGYGASAQLGDSIYIIGGDPFSGITDTVEVFDTRSKHVYLGTFLPIPRKGTTAVTFNDTIYVIGGVTSQSSQPTALVQKYSYGPTGIFDSGTPNLIESAQLVAYPNPFNSTIEFKLEIPRSSLTKLSIYDLQGRTIKQLVNEPLFQGTHFFQWDGKDFRNSSVASGIYFAILKGDSFYRTTKIFYIK